jgi:hypothetical protein
MKCRHVRLHILLYTSASRYNDIHNRKNLLMARRNLSCLYNDIKGIQKMVCR